MKAREIKPGRLYMTTDLNFKKVLMCLSSHTDTDNDLTLTWMMCGDECDIMSFRYGDSSVLMLQEV